MHPLEHPHPRRQNKAEHKGEDDGKMISAANNRRQGIAKRKRPPRNTVLISEGIGKSSSTGEAAIGAATEGRSAAVRPASDLSFSIAAMVLSRSVLEFD